MDKIVIVGGVGHAKSVMSVIKKNGTFTVLGYVDIKDNGDILGIPYLGNDEQLKKIIKENPQCCAAIGVGSVGISDKRERIKSNLDSLGFRFPAIASPTAIINEDVTIGKGTIIHDGAIINAGSVVGSYSIINTRSSIDHDCHIGNFVHIAPGVVLSGGVSVGDNSLIGVGASVVHERSIGKDCIVGAGAVVSDDCMEPGTYLGVPAKRKT